MNRIFNHKFFYIGFLAFVFSIFLQSSSLAETTIERIKRTGVIRAGAWKDAEPFGYVNEKGKWVGYGIDMMTVVKSQLEKALKKPLKLELIEVNTQNRFDLVMDGKVDISCGPTTFTWNREKYVDFSLSYFVTGTQLLVKKGTKLDSLKDLRSLRIGVERNTTTENVLKVLDTRLNLVTVANGKDGFSQLQQGKIDVYAGDGILLEALKQRATKPDTWEIVPPDDLISRESYACLLRENDSNWRDFVNYSILRAIQGYLIEDPEFKQMFDGWFGESGVVPYSQEVLTNHFQGIVDSVERIPKTAF
ncbi:MAG: amino acid ABC transporter substrate-binding protein [Prochloraceae cyanobacterium]|nr:amino acid ABC transporter substrate-binding protein [Prochloraceae cyanobacterium]